MDNIGKSFLAEIERFLQTAGLEPTTLGKQALADPSFVFDLRRGRSPSTRTIAKVRAWIEAQHANAPKGPATAPLTSATGETQAMASPKHELTHLERLEAESIHIICEVAAECEKPVMLYSIGKDSAVMLHLAIKAFYPSKPPFPLMQHDGRVLADRIEHHRLFAFGGDFADDVDRLGFEALEMGEFMFRAYHRLRLSCG